MGGGGGEPRRTKSMPSKYMIPSEDMGEYESGASRRKSAPAKPPVPPGGGLFPLDEQGTYGAAPRRPGMPPTAPSTVPFQRIRERKPKVYASYAINNDCTLHQQKLAKAESSGREGIRKNSGGSVAGSRPGSRAGSRAGSIVRASPSPARRVSGERRYSSYGGGSRGPSPSRASSSGRSSRSPDRHAESGYSSRKTSGEKTYSSYGGGGSNIARRSSSTSSFRKSSGDRYRDIPIQRSSIQESEQEYSYAENNTQNGYSSSLRRSSSTRMTSSYANGSSSISNGYSNGNSNPASGGGLSLGGMSKPKIDSWDSMGILGLTSKIWNDSTTKRQETFMESTGQFLREETTSYIM